MKLSFVIPAFNEEAYIGNCLESILKEAKGKDYDLEIIVVDNASTDKTAKIASSFKGVKVVKESKKGLVIARQTGYLASKGDVIANVDADTKLTKGWIDKVIKEFSNPRLVGLSGPFIYHDIPKRYKILVRIFYFYAFSLYLVSRFIFSRASMLQGGNFVVRRTALKKIGGFDEEHFSFYGEDADIARRLHSVGKVKWTFSFPMYSSARRLAAEGFSTMCTRYTMNYVWVALFGKPFTGEVIDIRFKGINKYLKIRPISLKRELLSGIIVVVVIAVFFPLVAPVVIGYLIYSLIKS